MSRLNWLRTRIVLAALALVVGMRILPYALERLFGLSTSPLGTAYPFNFNPMMAFALFGGAVLVRKGVAPVLPLLAFILGDIGLYLLKGQEFVFYEGIGVIYLSFAIAAVMGWRLRNRPLGRIGLERYVWVGLLAEIQFFVLTNFASWYTFAGRPVSVYTRDLAGLWNCYVAGLPFFGRSLVSTVLYGAAFFGALAWVERRELQMADDGAALAVE